MAMTSSREFSWWQAFLDEEDVKTTKQDYYLAQTAMAAHGAGGKLSDYLLDFSGQRQARRRGPTTEEAKAWFAAHLGGGR